MTGVSRRRFVRLAGSLLTGGVAATLLAACGPTAAQPTAVPAKPTDAPKPAATSAPAAAPTTAPAAAAKPTEAAKPAEAAKPTAAAQAGPVAKPKSGASLKILLWSHFVPAYDEWIDNYAKSWGEKNKVDVKVDHIRNADIPARLAAEASAGAGHDLFEFQAVLQAATYRDKLVDLTDVANVVGPKYGGWTDIAKTFGVVDGKVMAIRQAAGRLSDPARSQRQTQRKGTSVRPAAGQLQRRQSQLAFGAVLVRRHRAVTRRPEGDDRLG